MRLTSNRIDSGRARRIEESEGLPTRLLIAAAALSLAFAVDALSGGRWSWIAGGAAAGAALAALFPRLRWLVAAVGAYAGVWLGFNLLRAGADDTGWADRVLGLVPRIEAWLFGGRLPSAALQERLYHPPPLAWYDYGWTAVYLSFFVAPYLVAALLLWRGRRLFRRYLVATGVVFALSLVGFFGLPTAPPWLATEAVPSAGFDQVRRVTEEVLAALDLPFRLFGSAGHEGARGSEVRFEPNPIAAMPSIHFAATALLAFPARRAGRAVAAAAILYAGLMGVALVYLGEHYVLDLVAGGIFAAVGWSLGGRWEAPRRQGSPPRPPVHPRSPTVTERFTGAHRDVHARRLG